MPYIRGTLDRNVKRLGRLGACALVGMMLNPVSALVMAQPAVTTDATAIAAIASRVRAEVTRLPATSTVQEYEAAILFLVDQSSEPGTSVCAAFDLLYPDTSIPGNAKQAMRNVCRSVGRRRGTGAVPVGAGGFGPAGFSAPVIGPGGGGSNYSQ